MKYYAIGDIHGRFDLLEKAVDKIYTDNLHKNDDYKIVTLGDYIDRGPQSKQVIEFLMAQEDRFICLQGNHEAMAVESVLRSLDPSWWVGNGGGTTLLSYGHPDVRYMEEVMYSFMPQEHIKWMAGLPKYYEAERQLFVHAGVPQQNMNLPPKKIRDPLHDEMQWMLYHPSDHGGWKGKHVVHGHHQFADGPHTWSPGSKGGGRTNLDVFSWKTGRSIIGVFDDTQLTPLEFLEVKIETDSGNNPV